MVKTKKVTVKKRKQAHRNLTGLACIIFFIITIAYLSSGFAFPSDAEEPASTFKYYTEIRVSRGMTLWDLAERYATEEYESHRAYIAEVKEINNIYEDTILYGQYLTIPYYSEEVK